MGGDPVALAVNGTSGDVYVANFNTANVSIISPSTDTVVATAAVGTYPSDVAYDSVNQKVYSADNGPSTGGDVTVINGKTGVVVATIPAARYINPRLLLPDPQNGNLYVSDNGLNSNVSIINGSTDLIDGYAVVSFPGPLGYDRANGDVYVLSWPLSTLSIFSPLTQKVVSRLPVGVDAWGLAYNPKNSEMYVVNPHGPNVTAIDGTTNSILTTISVGLSPQALAIDPVTGYVFVANYGADTVSVIDSSTNRIIQTVPVGVHPNAVLVDRAVGVVLVSNEGGNNLSVIDANSLTPITSVTVGSTPEGMALDSVNGEVYVLDPYANSVWAVTPSRLYPVDFAESGLPSGTSWSVTLDGVTERSTAPKINFTDPNGTYGYSLGGVAGWTTTSFHGSVSVAGAAVSKVIAWVRTEYLITFAESGLPGGTQWTVHPSAGPSNTSMGTTLSLSESNGSYGYSISTPDHRYSGSSGSFAVAGQPVAVSVSFGEVTYKVTFTESGLKPGATWWVNFSSGSTGLSSVGTLLILEANGSYPYTIATTDKTYAAAPGMLSVAGQPTSITVVFGRVTYSLRFTESDLPVGTAWSVTLGGATKTGAGDLLFTGLVNGSYSYSVGAGGGYVANPSAGTAKVNGANATEPIIFTGVSGSPGGGAGSRTIIGLPSLAGLALIGGIAVILVGGAALVIVRRHRLRMGRGPTSDVRDGEDRTPPEA